MAFEIFNDPQQSAAFFLAIFFTPTCIVATILRFIASRRSLGKFGREDWLALAALLIYIIFIVGYAAGLSVMNGKPQLELPPDITTQTLMTCAKFSILFLYHRLFGVNRSFSLWITLVGIFQLLYLIATFLTSLLICSPVQKYWQPELPGRCINVAAFMTGVETANSLVDFAMVALAMLMLRNLQITFRTKCKLGVIFILGGLAGIIGFIKIGFSFHITIETQMILGLWSLAQMAFSIICCCAITYKPLLADTGVLHRVLSNISAYGSGWLFSQKRSRNSAANDSHSFINLDGSGRGRGQVSTNVHGKQSRDTGSQHSGISNGYPSGYQMRTIDVQQSSEQA